MLRLTILAAMTSATLMSPAYSEGRCTLANNYCVPFVGCTGDGANFYLGQTFGRRSGPVQAQGLDGSTCTGTWKRTALGAGVARFECSDGITGRARYTYFDSSSGTAVGRGRTSAGDRLSFLAGHRVEDYIAAAQGFDADLLACVKRALAVQGG